MASKLQNFFPQDKNSAAQELQSPAPPLKRKVIFRRHSETTVILSFTNKHHMGENGRIEFIKGEIMGDLLPNFARSFRKDGHKSYRSEG